MYTDYEIVVRVSISATDYIYAKQLCSVLLMYRSVLIFVICVILDEYPGFQA